MNVLLLSIDSLSRTFLDTYDDRKSHVDTTNLDRFADRALTFDTHYAGSLPCMPARREWLTGTREFLWRPWGPIEPFDETIPYTARQQGVLSQLITDHFHYFQHGSHGYYEDFNGFEFVRGHEYDAWKTSPRDPEEWLLRQVLPEAPEDVDDIALTDGTAGGDPHDLRFMNRAQYARNGSAFEGEEDFFAPRVLSGTADWLGANADWEQWFCYVDSFDVHEPFHNPEPYASMYTDEDPRDPELTIWPFYGRTDAGQSELIDRELDFVESQFAGNVTMVDRWFGEVLDALDEHDLWDETMVVVTSDHGFYLGEHGWIGKPYRAPLYDTLARTPLLIWHPDSPRTGERTAALTSAIDLHATVVDALGLERDTRHSRSLLPLVRGDADSVREYALYGFWGSSINVTDGRYTYHHPCRGDEPTPCFSTSMMNPYGWFVPDDPQSDAESGRFLPYTDSPVWRYEAPSYSRHESPMLFDAEADPDQHDDLYGEDDETAGRLRGLLERGLYELNAPQEQYRRFDLSAPGE